MHAGVPCDDNEWGVAALLEGSEVLPQTSVVSVTF